MKTALGMRDFKPEEMAVREVIMGRIVEIFKKHGAVRIETPVLELKSTLTGKYGEDSKLIYELKDQGGELLAMRYDLTVPFARYVAMTKTEKIKRYHIARVYRRDRPAMEKGRYREFYQCDIDIAGTYESMIPDAECVKIVTEILQTVNVGDFVVKVNHRRLLDGMFEVCGVPASKFRAICSAVDKLDKMEWKDVKDEMVSKKGLDPAVADKIGKYVSMKPGAGLVAELENDSVLMANESAKTGVAEMKKMLRYCKIMGVPDKNISFNLSLARGLDYYTGVIYEAVLVGARVGSVAGGGRYDNLVGMFMKQPKKKNKKAKQIPCVGVSIGIERLFAVVESQAKEKKSRAFRTFPTEVLVTSGNADSEEMMEERMAVLRELWNSGINAEMEYKKKNKFQKSFKECNEKSIPFLLIVGEDEKKKGIVQFKFQVDVGDHKTKDSLEVQRSSMGEVLLKIVQKFRDNQQ